MGPYLHRSVLLDAVVDGLLDGLAARCDIAAGAAFLDCTLGGGGHAAALLERGPAGCRLVGLDRDGAALEASATRLAAYGDRASLRRGAFADLQDLAGRDGPFHGIVMDLGVSSPQLDQAERGFSFQADARPDMRMDDRQPLDAAGLLDQLDEDELADILFRYGDEPRSRRIARAIVAGRPWTSTRALARCIAESSGYQNSRTNPATRTFQALRYAVNDEPRQLELGLRAALAALAPGARLAVISFNSIEDRTTKQLFRERAAVGTARDGYGHPLVAPSGRLVHPGGISGADQDADNPRARSARLRFFESSARPT